jgi:hypothetical protein
MPLLVTSTVHGWRAIRYRQERDELSVAGHGLQVEDDSWTRALDRSWQPDGEDGSGVAVLDPLVGMRSLLAMVHDSRNFAIARMACQNLGAVITGEALGHGAIGGGDLLDLLDQKAADAVFTRPSSSQLQALAEGIERQRKAGYAREVVLMTTAEMKEPAGTIRPTATVDWPGGDTVQQVAALERALALPVERLFRQAPGVVDLEKAWPGPVQLRARAMMAAARSWAPLETAPGGTQLRVYDLEPGAVTAYTVHNGHGFRAAYHVWGHHSPGLAKPLPDGLLPPAAGLTGCPNGPAVAAWLPFAIRQEELENEVANYLMRPGTIPETWRELMIRMAVARAVARRAAQVATANQPEGISFAGPRRVVVTGGLVAGGHEGVILWLILDLAEPTGITPIYLDPSGLLPGLGALALAGRPLEAQEPDGSTPVPLLTTCIAPLSQSVSWEKPRHHSLAMASVQIPGENPAILRLQPGKITRLPATAGKAVRLRLQPVAGYDFGTGSGRVWEGTLHGGKLGLVFDTRGRPLVLPAREDTRISLLQDWLAEVRRACP